MKKFLSFVLMAMFVFSLACSVGAVIALVDPDVERAEIDVVYKYIDFQDPTLKRGNDNLYRHSRKDDDNNELMYSLRSVMKNIPWVRKIFIIMPNDKVRFLKTPEEISDKIIYIKNEDLLGFDSNSSVAFKWNFWRLKDFGCSNHILYFCDDYFIGKPMKKSDFFYKNEKGDIVPYIFYKEAIKYTTKKDLHTLLNKLDKQYDSMTQYIPGSLYKIQNARAYDFLYTALNKNSLYIPAAKNINATIHNAVGFNLNEIEELYNIINSKYKYADYCLRGLKRNKYDMWMVALYPFYFLNKENRKINTNITYRYFDMAAKDINNNYNLFCINTGGGKDYSDIERLKAKIKMEQFFPEPTKYERKDYNDWAGVDPALKERLKNEMLTQKVVNNYRPRRSFRLRRAG